MDKCIIKLSSYTKKYCLSLKIIRNWSNRALVSQNIDIRRKRTHLFEIEKNRQLGLVKRMEKIEVHHKGVPEECTLIMNKNISTPYNCAMHIHELLMNRSVIALVNGKLWDMHRPLEENCELQFLHFLEDDPHHVNKAFWRSCSFMLGFVAETAFKEGSKVELHSWPPPNVRTGSFVYDIYLGMENWEPNTEEFRMLTYVWNKINQKELHFERLDMDASVALRIFEDNKFKVQQIPSIAAQSKDGCSVTVYRLGDQVDMSRGPMISNTKLFGRMSICAAHLIETKDFGQLYRFQGIALPKQLMLSFYTWSVLENRAKHLNSCAFPVLSRSERRKVKVEESVDSADQS